MNFYALTDEEARAILEQTRWPRGVRCVFCEGHRVGKVSGGRQGLYLCHACRKQFTVTVGTIFERSHLPLGKWISAAYLMCCSKKGISALQLQRMLGIGSYKCAWHMAHRLRRAMRPKSQWPLGGVVEADETYIGGKTRHSRMGRGSERKTPVVALLQRGGPVYAQVIKRATQRQLGEILKERVVPEATLMTDDWPAYRGPGRRFAAHGVVQHGHKEYVKGEAHVNTAESFFALLKRGIHGSYHHVSKQHLNRYCDEFAFRWTCRKTTDEERTKIMLGWTVGKRLYYESNNGHEALIRR